MHCMHCILICIFQMLDVKLKQQTEDFEEYRRKMTML